MKRDELLGPDDNAVLKRKHFAFVFPVMSDDELGCLRWRFCLRMGHEIGDGLILVVPDPGDHGDRKFGHRPSDPVIVKNQKIRLCAATPDDGQHIVRWLGMENPDDLFQEPVCIIFTLHGCEIIIYGELVSEGIIQQGMFEIFCTRRGAGRDDRDSLNHGI